MMETENRGQKREGDSKVDQSPLKKQKTMIVSEDKEEERIEMNDSDDSYKDKLTAKVETPKVHKFPVRVPFAREKSYRCWELGVVASIRVGIIGNKVRCRLSCVRDLIEERPPPPVLFSGMDDKFIREQDEDGDDIISNTAFLTLDEIKGLEQRVSEYFELLEDNPDNDNIIFSERLVEMSDKEKEDFEDFPYLSDLRTTIKIQRKIAEITTYALWCGDNQQQQYPKSTAKVFIWCDELKKLHEVIGEVFGFMSKLKYSHSNLANLIRIEAGKCLSKMLFCEYGKFTKQMIDRHDSRLMESFLTVHGEFLGMGYGSSLITKMFEETSKQKIKTGYIDAIPLMFKVVGQVKQLFSSKYLKCPTTHYGVKL
jgi:hypothetical protein